MTNHQTTIAEIVPGTFAVVIDGAVFSAPTRLLATILAANLTTLQPEETDWLAWAEHYVAEIWPDELTRLHGYEVDLGTMTPSDVQPGDYLHAAMDLGLIELPADANFDYWHPTGCQLIIGPDEDPEARIVMTGWNDANAYDVGIYLTADYDEMWDAAGTFDTLDVVDCDDLVDHVRQLVDERPWRRFERRTVATDPLPQPTPDAARLAAAYLAQVRQNGPWAVANVAGAGEAHGSDYHPITDADWTYHAVEIGAEIGDANGLPMPETDADFALRDAAAVMAINACRASFNLPKVSA